MIKQLIISHTYAISISVLVVSWILNALSDSIDHGQGAKKLDDLWHLIKSMSYGILFIWIAVATIIIHPMSIGWIISLIFMTLLILFAAWELTYAIAKYYNFQSLDDKIEIKFMHWLWK